MERPGGLWAEWVLGNNWPEDASIASLQAVVDGWRSQIGPMGARVAELESARDRVAASMVGEDFEPMHQRMSQLVKDRQAIVDGIVKYCYYGDLIIEQCHTTQKALYAETELAVAAAKTWLAVGNQQMAQVEIVTGENRCTAIVAESCGDVSAWAESLQAALPVVKPMTWGSGSLNPRGGGSTARPMSFDPMKQSGGPGPKSPGGGRFSGQSDQAEEGAPAAAAAEAATSSAAPSDGKRSAAADQQPGDGEQADQTSAAPDGGTRSGSADQAGEKPGDHLPEPRPGRASGEAEQAPADPAPLTSFSAPPISSAGASSSGGSSLGSASSGLGGLTGGSGLSSGSGSVLGGVKAPDGVVAAPGSFGRPPVLGAPAAQAGGAGTGGVGSAGSPRVSEPGGGGGGVPRVGALPGVPMAGVSSAPPVPPTPSAAVGAAPSAGGFGANAAGVQPITAPAASGVASGSSAGAPVSAPAVGMAPVGGAASVPAASASAPAAQQMGAAPTASPGLSQGSIGSGGSTTPGSVGGVPGSAGSVGVIPAGFSEDAPAGSANPHAALAANTVKMLIPGVATYPGLAVAAAVVRVAGGVPRVVMATNEGMGYLPRGVFVPPGLLHAFAEIDTPDYDLKWVGWVDAARTLIDYVVCCEQRGEPTELLGLASSVVVSEETKALFPAVVPRVEPPPGGRPLGWEHGNRHRLQVLAPMFFERVAGLSERARGQAAAAATRAAMALDVAAPFAGAGSAPMQLLSGRDLTAEQWAALREDYTERVITVGTMRPGFVSAGRDTASVMRYREAFRQLRVLETVLCWEGLPDLPVEDVLYAAYQAGVDVNRVMAQS